MTSPLSWTKYNYHRICRPAWSTNATKWPGLRLNASKTKVMAYNIEEDIPISTLDESVLAVVDDFKYIGSHLSLCESDACMRKVQARRALSSMNHIEILYVQPAQTTFFGGKSGIGLLRLCETIA